MNRQFPYRLFIACAAIAVAQSLAVPTARATCGDWLAHPEEPAASSATELATGEGDASRPIRTPCHGPRCGKAPVPGAPTAPATFSSPSPKHLLVARIRVNEWLGPHFFGLADEDAHPCQGHPSRIDHPPRV